MKKPILTSIYKKIKKFIATTIFKRKYERVGKCAGCGQCCTHIYVRHAKNVVQTEEEFKKLKLLHPFYTYLNVIGKDETGLIFECKNRDEETKLCKIHKSRPNICRRYPQEEIFMMGGALAENCGYSLIPYKSFEEVFSAVKKKGKNIR